METVATGLLIPEGPVALSDGSVLIVEVGAGRISRLHPDGALRLVAQVDGGPNGAAIGPDGAAYICNNGGGFACDLVDGLLHITFAPERYVGGSIQRKRRCNHPLYGVRERTVARAERSYIRCRWQLLVYRPWD